MRARTVPLITQSILILSLAAGACGKAEPSPPTQPPPTSTLVLLAPTETPTVEVVMTDLPAPEPTDVPRTLTLCIGAEPENLYIFGSSMLVQEHVLNAVYDGPIDLLSFEPRPVILEKIPSLADGDARIEPAAVQAGDRVVNAEGEVVSLAAGDRIRPAGCRAADCEIDYTQGEVVMDRLSVDFTLLPGLLWSDGAPLTAADSVYSFELARSTVEISEYFTYRVNVDALERTSAYEALDIHTTRWTGLPGFLDPDYRTNFWSPLPQHAWGKYTPEELLYSDMTLTYPLGWGPYVIDDYRIGSHITLSKNPNYFRASEGLPTFDRLVFRFVDENSTRNIARLTSGECDVVDQDAQLDDSLPELIDLDRGGFLNLEATPGTVFEHLDFGIRPAQYDDGYQLGVDRPDFFGDLLVRQAIAFCIDREAINDALYAGRSEVYQSYLPAGHPLALDEDPVITHDPVRGRAQLEAAGWYDEDDDPETPRTGSRVVNVPDGTPFTIQLWTTAAETRRIQAEMIRESLADCGIRVETQFWDPGDFFADGPVGPIFGRQFDMALFAWLTGERPPCEYWQTDRIPGEDTGWQGENDTGYSNKAYDEACRAAWALLPGEPGYEAQHRLALQIFKQDLPILPLVARMKIVATGPDLCGLVMDPTANSEMWNLEEFNRGEGCD